MWTRVLSLIAKVDNAIAALEAWYYERNMNEPAPVVPTAQPAPETPAVPTLTNKARFDGFIIQYEGANPANNNPFDDKYYYGGYLEKYGTVKESSGGFAMFSTYALGYEYGSTITKEIMTAHQDWNFYEFFSYYAPTKDENDPVKYAQTVAGWCGVPPTTVLYSYCFN